MSSADTTPLKLDLKKDLHLTITWQDGRTSVYTIDYLRTMCPCASCKTHRENQAQQKAKKQLSLTILPGNYSGQLQATGAELVGGYAVRIRFSDHHESGIFSFGYLRQIDPHKDAV